jgi:hypothetical protein
MLSLELCTLSEKHIIVAMTETSLNRKYLMCYVNTYKPLIKEGFKLIKFIVVILYRGKSLKKVQFSFTII